MHHHNGVYSLYNSGWSDTIIPDDVIESFSFRLLKNGSAFYWVLYVCRAADSSCSKILPSKQDIMQCSVATVHWHLAFLGEAEQEIVVNKWEGKEKGWKNIKLGEEHERKTEVWCECVIIGARWIHHYFINNSNTLGLEPLPCSCRVFSAGKGSNWVYTFPVAPKSWK